MLRRCAGPAGPSKPAPRFPVSQSWNSLGDLLARNPKVIAEVAGQQAVSEHGPEVLRKGFDLLVISIGALAEPQLLERLKTAAVEGNSRLLLPAGAIGGIDAIAAMRVGGLNTVRYRSRKPPAAWRGSPAEKVADLDKLTARTVLYRGHAGEAALRYPQNANVAAAVALAGLGFEKTEVELVADPEAPGNVHEIEAEGAAGKFADFLAGPAVADQSEDVDAGGAQRRARFDQSRCGDRHMTVPTRRATNAFIGSPIERLEDLRFLTGRGQYTDDLTSADMLHAVILRSSVAHGRIRSIDTAAARKMPGIHAVITAAEIGEIPTIPLRHDPLPTARLFVQPIIATGKVRFVGEAMAVVVADSVALAEDALEAIVVDIEPLPAVVVRDEARRAGTLAV